MDAKRAEYIARINRVIDHIEAHLDEPLSLDHLARVACFSPYHFHRVFAGVVGETLKQFTTRLRLERAAQKLILNPKESVTEIALGCGFSSSATFARAFRDAFGTSASELRAAGEDGLRKIRKTLRKPRKAMQAATGHPDSALEPDGPDAGGRDGIMTTTARFKDPIRVEVETLPELFVAYVRHVGPYKGQAELFAGLWGKLMGWVGPRGLIGPDTKMLAVYHDSPEVTDEDKLRTSVCVTVPRETRGEGEIGTMTIAGGKYALLRFEVAQTEYQEAWSYVFCKWLPSSGYQPDDRPCFELYLNDCEQHPEKKQIVDIGVPVRPL